jgi:hypothetical protein
MDQGLIFIVHRLLHIVNIKNAGHKTGMTIVNLIHVKALFPLDHEPLGASLALGENCDCGKSWQNSGTSPLTARCSLGGVMEGRLRGEEKKCQASSVETDKVWMR